MNTFSNQLLRPVTLFICASILAIAILVIGFMNHNLGTQIVIQGSYYVILVMSLFWVYLIFPFIRESIRGKTKPLLACLIATGIVFLSMPPKYRVLSDETNLLSVSQSMTYKKEFTNVTQSKFYYGNFNPVQADLPTRPLLFPYLTSLIHTLTGYRYQNVFVLNFILLFALLSLTYLCVESTLGSLSAASACLLILSIPTLTLSATSGGFDLCSLFFFALSFVFLYRFLEFPTPERFAMLLIQLILLSQIRYESIAYVAVIFIGLLLSRRITLELCLKNVVLLSATPFFMIPMFLQRRLTPNTFENPPGVPPFALEHFFKHFKLLVENMVFFKPEFPYPSLLNLLSVAILCVLVFKWMPKASKTLKPHQNLFIKLLITCVGISLAIVLSHHFGVFPHPTQARLFLVFLAFLALIPVFFHSVFPTILTPNRLFLLSVISFSLYHPVSIQGRFTNSLTIIRETEDIYHYLETLNDPKILVIAERPGQITVANYGAVGFSYTNNNKISLINDLNRGLYSEIIVFQKYVFETGRPIDDQALAPEFALEPIKEFMVSATEYVRISKVKHGIYRSEAPKLNPDFKKILDEVKFK